MMDKSKGGNDTLNIVMMHGMGIKGDTIFDKFGHEIANQMGFRLNRVKNYNYPTMPWMKELHYDKDSMLADQSILRIMEFREKKDTNRVIRFYSFVWSPQTIKSKTWLNALDDDRGRQKQNYRLKTKVVTEGLTDVVLYQNEKYRRFLQFSMVFAMAHTEAVNPFAEPDSIRIKKYASNANTVVMTTSLGSKFLWDVLGDKDRKTIFDYYKNNIPGFPMELKNPEQLFKPIAESRQQTQQNREVFKNFVDKIEHFVFLSNQLPLLGLTNATPDSYNNADQLSYIAYQGYLETDSLEDAKILNYRKDTIGVSVGSKKNLVDIKKVFFNDPNDMLGFQVPHKLLKSDKYVQVQMNYAKKNIFLLANPEKAHEGVTSFSKFTWKCRLFPKFRYRGGKRTATLLVSGHDGDKNKKRRCRCRMTEPSCKKCRK